MESFKIKSFSTPSAFDPSNKIKYCQCILRCVCITGSVEVTGSDSNMNIVNVANPLSSSAFGDQVNVNPFPNIQLQFPYSLNNSNTIVFTNGSGQAVGENSQLVLTSGTAPLSDAAVASKDNLDYQPGFGATVRFTFGCTTGSATIGTVQQAGIGTQEDGFFFSYGFLSDDMYILHRKGGLRNQYTLTITSGATLSGNVNLIVDGISYTKQVTVSDINTNVVEIASLLTIGSGFDKYILNKYGNTVSIIAQRTGDVPVVSFDPGNTGIQFNLLQQVVGVVENTTYIPRSEWNIDKADGTGTLPLIDWTKGNVYQIRYQWLGYGAITFYLEEPTSGFYTPVHRIQYANTSITPSINQPSLQFLTNVSNINTENNITSFVGSVCGNVDGNLNHRFGNRKALTYNGTTNPSNTTPTSLFALVNPPFFQNKSSRTTIYITRVVITSKKDFDFYIVRNPTLKGNTIWNYKPNTLLMYSSNVVNTVESVQNLDILFADRLFVGTAGENRLEILPYGYEDYICKIYPGDVISFVINNTGSGEIVYTVSLNWVEST